MKDVVMMIQSCKGCFISLFPHSHTLICVDPIECDAACYVVQMSWNISSNKIHINAAGNLIQNIGYNRKTLTGNHLLHEYSTACVLVNNSYRHPPMVQKTVEGGEFISSACSSLPVCKHTGGAPWWLSDWQACWLPAAADAQQAAELLYRHIGFNSTEKCNDRSTTWGCGWESDKLKSIQTFWGKYLFTLVTRVRWHQCFYCGITGKLPVFLVGPRLR